MLRSTISGMCLDLYSYTVEDGLAIVLWSCDVYRVNLGWQQGQVWTFEPAVSDNSTGFLTNILSPSRCLTVYSYEGPTFVTGSPLELRQCDFNGTANQKVAQLWEFVKVCNIPGINAYNESCRPECKKTEYVKGDQCVECPIGQFAHDDVCRKCPSHQFWNTLTETCASCPDGTIPTEEMLGCEDETFIGLTEIQWAAVGVALAAVSLCAGALLACRRVALCKGVSKEPGTLETHTPEPLTVKAVIVDSDDRKIVSPQDSTPSNPSLSNPTDPESNPTDPESNPKGPDPYVEVEL
eukprot:Skav201721  [mRNA]  locus=scaffold311:521896:522780:- [translate_table: standard]